MDHDPLAKITESYILSHSPTQPISTAAAVAKIRSMVFTAEHTDRELADLVALAAVRLKYPVKFDPIDGAEE